MEEIRITPTILALKQTSAEKMLLAYICQRAVATDGTCVDTNKELGEALAMHAQTISDLINRLRQTRWLEITEQKGITQRVITPYTELIEGYKPIAYPSPKPITYPIPSNTDTPLSQSLTPRPPITDSRLWAGGKTARVGQRFCPVTSVDIGRQQNDVHYVTAITLKYLARKQPIIFLAIAKAFFPGETPDLDYPGEMSSRIARAVQQLIFSGRPFEPLVLPDRICPVTGLNLNHQGISYTHATASTLSNLFKQDRALFDEVAAYFLTTEELAESMSGQIMMLSNRVERKAHELGSSSQLSGWPVPVLSRSTSSQSTTLSPSQLAMQEKRPVRYCPVTSIDITHQRLDCRFATRTTLHRLYHNDQTWAERLFDQFLTPDQLKESAGIRLWKLTERVRKIGLSLPIQAPK